MTPLTTRDTNIQNDPPATTTEKHTAAGEENMAQASQQHRQVLEQKIADNNSQSGQAYISPSDAILSPASQKLSDLKSRQMGKPNGNPLARRLFGRTPSSSSNGFDGIDAATSS